MRFAKIGLVLLLLVGGTVGAPQAQRMPSQLTDAEFWRIFTEFSEPTGDYPYQNYMTNEETVQDVLPVLTKVTKPGGVYLGVGPEQNFTYIAGVKPTMAFIFDIRRQNALEHLMYKAIFELSPTRAEFVSRLFSIKTKDKVPADARANALFLSIEGLKADRAYYSQNLEAIKANLLRKHKFALSADDVKKIEFVCDIFFRAGPELDYKFESEWPPQMAPAPNYQQAMTDTDADKKAWSFLATEENYQVVRNLQMKNLLIPVVGDFAGSKALRSVADYSKQRNAIVSAFYVSNVEYYLAEPRAPRGTIQRFYENVTALPLDSTSLFIRFVGQGDAMANLRSWWKTARWLQAVSPMADLSAKVKSGETPNFAQALQLIPDPKTLVP